MTTIKKLAAVAAVSTLAFVATDLSASAQSALTNDPTHPMVRRHPMSHTAVRGPQHVSYAYRRPLTVRRTVVTAPVVVAVPVVPDQGPGSIVTGPLGLGSNLVSLPFRGLNAIFPATGDVTANPLVLIGAPLHAIGDLVQVPFRVVGAPFGGTTIATY